MNTLETLVKLRDDIKTWVTNNLNALNAKIDEKTIPIDGELNTNSTNPVQNKAIAEEINNLLKEINSLSQQIANKSSFSGDYNDLTNAPNIAEDDSGNMIIADESGNIIFKADAEGIHTTAVSLNGETAATEKYVDEAVASIPTPDVSGQINAHNASEEAHADIRQAIEDTKEELSESIVAESDEWKIVDEAGNIIFSVDAEGAHTTELTLNGESAATESYVDNAIANIEFPTTDLTDYTTKEYVDNKVADLVNSAPEALDTLGELAAALENHEDAYDALLETVGSKATHTDLENLKEELSESITAEAEDWKVVDGNGNIIFSVDNTGAHTISLTLNGEEAATKTYVNEAISDIEFPEADFTGYATEKYVDEAIAAIPQTDLTGYATEKYVDDAVAAIDIPETDLSGYYTKEQTDTAINTVKEELSESIVAESEEWKVVDEAGNIIFSVDASGAHTTALTLNGESVEEMIDSKVDKVDGKGLSTNDFTNEYKTKLDNINEGGGGIVAEEDPTVPAWAKEAAKPTYTANEVGALADTTVLADLTDDATHRTVTDTEKASWNAKSEFSGDYNDLENAPNITEDGAGDLVIADKNGNIIFRSNSDGFETTKLTAEEILINGQTIQELVQDQERSIYDVAETNMLVDNDNNITKYLVFYCGTATELID